MKKVLVTGTAGFIAPHITNKCLSNGWHVTGVDILDPEDYSIINHPNYVFIKKDVRDLKTKSSESPRLWSQFVCELQTKSRIPENAGQNLFSDPEPNATRVVSEFVLRSATEFWSQNLFSDIRN